MIPLYKHFDPIPPFEIAFRCNPNPPQIRSCLLGGNPNAPFDRTIDANSINKFHKKSNAKALKLLKTA